MIGHLIIQLAGNCVQRLQLLICASVYVYITTIMDIKIDDVCCN